MQELLQNLLPDVSAAQAWGIWLLRSTLKPGYYSTSARRKENKTLLLLLFFLFFFPPGELSGNHFEGGLFPHMQTFFSSSFFSSLLLLRTVHFISEWEISPALTCFSSRAACFCRVVYLLTYLCYSCTFLPPCMSRMFYYAFTMLSSVFCIMCLSMAVMQSSTFFLFFFYRPHKRYQKGALWMTVHV